MATDSNMTSVYGELVEHLVAVAATLRRGQQYMVAVGGAPASGKSTTTARVAQLLNEQRQIPTAVVPMDGYHYYKAQLDAMDDPEEKHKRRGAHWTFDGARFVSDLARAREAGHGSFPGFDHHQGDPIEDQIKVEAQHRIVLVEGNYVLLYGVEPWAQLRPLFDEKWYISCDLEIARERVIKRHVSTGDSIERATFRADYNDCKNAVLIDEGSRRHADRIINSR